MTRPVDWAPLCAADPTPGNPAEVDSLSQYWRTCSNAFQQASSDVRNATVDGQGQSINALQNVRNELAATLSRYEGECSKLVGLLAGWSRSLDSFQNRAAELLKKAIALQDDLSEAGTKMSAAGIGTEDYDATLYGQAVSLQQNSASALQRLQAECEQLQTDYQAEAKKVAAAYQVLPLQEILNQIGGSLGQIGGSILAAMLTSLGFVFARNDPVAATSDYGVGVPQTGFQYTAKFLVDKVGGKYEATGGRAYPLRTGLYSAGTTPGARFSSWFKAFTSKTGAAGSLASAFKGASFAEAPTFLTKTGLAASRFAGPVAVVVGAGVSGFQQWNKDSQANPNMPDDVKGVRTGAVAGTAALAGVGGVWAGAAIGAGIGSIFPGPGTVIGGLVGGIVGGLATSQVVEALSENIADIGGDLYKVGQNTVSNVGNFLGGLFGGSSK